MLNSKKHIFDKEGKHLLTQKVTEVVGIIGNPTLLTNSENQVVYDSEDYDYPLVLKEGKIVQDPTKAEFEGKWYPAEEAQAMKAEREKAAKS